MLARTLSFAAVAGLVTFAVASSFLGAAPGVAIPFTPVFLPQVAISGTQPLPHGKIPGGPFAPTYSQVLDGNLVIRTDAEMRAVWQAVFTRPYDPTLFDFSSTFVIWMASGPMQLGSFGISDVEEVQGSFADMMWFGGGGTANETFLAATSVTFMPGIYPQDPPPPTYRVSAVKVDRAKLDDVVFHRSFIAGV